MMKAEMDGTDGNASLETSRLTKSRCGSFSKPSWLLSTIADTEERIQKLASDINEPEGKEADTFAQRAESYYRKRPLLLSLLHDLYNRYLSLADRYSQSLCKQPSLPPPLPRHHFDSDDDESNSIFTLAAESDAESSLSYQPSLSVSKRGEFDPDLIVAELVMKNVKYEFAMHELGLVEKRWDESSRKIELQRSLLEVLESERLVLLNENARLGYRVAALAEENKGLVSDSLYMKRKASELARCVLKMREDHRVCVLSRKIEDLQEQIYHLEKRNKEYYERLVKQEEGRNSVRRLMMKSGNEVTLEDCFQGEEDGGSVSTTTTNTTTTSSGSILASLIKGRKCRGNEGSGGGRKVLKLWGKVKNFDMFVCGPHLNCTCC